LSGLHRCYGGLIVEEIKGHWLDPAVEAVLSTPGLGVRLEGRRERRVESRTTPCPYCGGQLFLLATYEKSVFVRLSVFALITLEFCPACSAESDGSSGGNGFFPLLRRAGESLSEPSLPEPIYFRATPTGEPLSEEEFRKWQPRIVRGKLGGRQLSIQTPLNASCEHCSGPLIYVSSIDEHWAPTILNFAGGFGYLFACGAECSPKAVLFYWDCD
jgi:hypothetical protein